MTQRIVSRQNMLLPAGTVEVFVIVTVFSTFLSYSLPSLASRALVIGASIIILASLVLAEHSGKDTRVLAVLAATSLLFLLVRAQFFRPDYIIFVLNTRPYFLSAQYAQTGHLIFGEEHSHFFAAPFVTYLLSEIAGVPYALTIYIALLVYGGSIVMITMILLRFVRGKMPLHAGSRVQFIAPLVGYSLISFSFSERSVLRGSFGALSIVMTLVLLAFVIIGKAASSRSYTIVLLLLVAGTTLGTADGILLLIAFFFLFSTLARRSTTVLYALIPLCYLLYSAYSYALSLKFYGSFALSGFYRFLVGVLSGTVAQRVFPWERTLNITSQDAAVLSVTYLSLLLLSVTLVVIMLFPTKKGQEEQEKNLPAVRSNAIALLLFTTIAVISYIGASTSAERSFSDIRTLVMTFVGLLLPFSFLSKRLLVRLGRNRILLGSVMLLLIFASFGNLYQNYPKSAQDPVLTVEDARLGTSQLYSVGEYIAARYKSGGIVVDYKVSNRLVTLLYSGKYEVSLLGEAPMSDLFSKFPRGGILVFNVAGIAYPSPYHSPRDYAEAYDYSLTHNRVYANGSVLLVTSNLGREY